MSAFVAIPFIEKAETDYSAARDAFQSASNFDALVRQFAEHRQNAKYELVAEVCAWLREGGDEHDEAYARLIETRWGFVL